MDAELQYLIRHALLHDTNQRMQAGGDPERHAWALEFLKTTLLSETERNRFAAEMALHVRLARQTGSPASRRAQTEIEQHYLGVAYRRAINDHRVPEALALAEQLAMHQDVPARDRSDALLKASVALRMDHRHEEAIKLAQRAMESASDDQQRAQAQQELANAYIFARELELAEEGYNRVLENSRESGDQRLESAALCNLGSVRRQQGRGQEAEVMFRRAIEVGREGGSREYQGTAHLQLGYLLGMSGREAEAETQLKSAIEVLEGTNKTMYRVDAASSLCDLATRAGNYAQAERYMELAMGIARQLGYRTGLAQAMNYGAMLFDAMGRGADVHRMLREAIEIARETGDQMNIGYGLANLGAQLLGDGKLDEAEQAFEQAQEAGRLARNPYIEGGGHNGVGDVRRAQGRLMEAWTCYEHSAHLMDMAGYPPGVLRANIKLAALTRETGDAAQSAERLRELQASAREAGLRGEFELASSELARALESLEDFAGAVAAWEHALEAADGTAAQGAIQQGLARCQAKAATE